MTGREMVRGLADWPDKSRRAIARQMQYRDLSAVPTQRPATRGQPDNRHLVSCPATERVVSHDRRIEGGEGCSESEEKGQS
jgi:hypothetical protein